MAARAARAPATCRATSASSARSASAANAPPRQHRRSSRRASPASPSSSRRSDWAATSLRATGRYGGSGARVAAVEPLGGELLERGRVEELKSGVHGTEQPIAVWRDGPVIGFVLVG